jgi:hypothetical protein
MFGFRAIGIRQETGIAGMTVIGHGHLMRAQTGLHLAMRVGSSMRAGGAGLVATANMIIDGTAIAANVIIADAIATIVDVTATIDGSCLAERPHFLPMKTRPFIVYFIS